MDDRKPRGPVWLIAVAGIIGVLLIARCGMTTRQSDVTAAAEAAAYELERTPVKGLGINIFDVENALAHGARDYRGRSTAGSIRVTDAGSDERGDNYEFTNDDGEYPVCLRVRLHIDLGDPGPNFPDVDVEEGHC